MIPWLKLKENEKNQDQDNLHLFRGRGASVFVPERNSILIYGGYNCRLSKYFDSFLEFDCSKDTLSELKENFEDTDVLPKRPTARINVSLNYYNASVILFGGYLGANLFNDLLFFDVRSLGWKKQITKGTTPPKRHSHYSIIYKDRLYIAGGIVDPVGTFAYDLWSLDLKQMEWTEHRPVGRFPYHSTGGLSFGKNAGLIEDPDTGKAQIYFFCGFENIFADLYIFDINKDIWLEQVPQMTGVVPARREGFMVQSTGDQIIVYGGRSLKGGYRSEDNQFEWVTHDGCFIFEPSGQWTEASLRNGPVSRSFCQASFTLAGEIFIYGGEHVTPTNDCMPLSDAFSLQLVISKNIKSYLAPLLNDEKSSDFTFIVEDRKIHAHQFIVFSRSSVLAERGQGQTSLTVTEYGYAAFYHFLFFLYTDKLEGLEHGPSLDDASKLVPLAESFKVPELAYCLENKLQIFVLPNPNTQLLKDLPQIIESLCLSEKFSDITFQVENEKIPAHKEIVKGGSQYFEIMFNTGMKEAHTSTIPIQDTTPQAFRLVLKSLYQVPLGANETISDEDIVEVMILAHQFQLSRLFRQCQYYLSTHLTDDIVGTVYQAALFLQLDSLAALAVDHIALSIYRESPSHIQSTVKELKEAFGPEFADQLLRTIDFFKKDPNLKPPTIPVKPKSKSHKKDKKKNNHTKEKSRTDENNNNNKQTKIRNPSDCIIM